MRWILQLMLLTLAIGVMLSQDATSNNAKGKAVVLGKGKVRAMIGIKSNNAFASLFRGGAGGKGVAKGKKIKNRSTKAGKGKTKAGKGKGGKGKGGKGKGGKAKGSKERKSWKKSSDSRGRGSKKDKSRKVKVIKADKGKQMKMKITSATCYMSDDKVLSKGVFCSMIPLMCDLREVNSQSPTLKQTCPGSSCDGPSAHFTSNGTKYQFTMCNQNGFDKYEFMLKNENMKEVKLLEDTLCKTVCKVTRIRKLSDGKRYLIATLYQPTITSYLEKLYCMVSGTNGTKVEGFKGRSCRHGVEYCAPEKYNVTHKGEDLTVRVCKRRYSESSIWKDSSLTCKTDADCNDKTKHSQIEKDICVRSWDNFQNSSTSPTSNLSICAKALRRSVLMHLRNEISPKLTIVDSSKVVPVKTTKPSDTCEKEAKKAMLNALNKRRKTVAKEIGNILTDLQAKCADKKSTKQKVAAATTKIMRIITKTLSSVAGVTTGGQKGKNGSKGKRGHVKKGNTKNENNGGKRGKKGTKTKTGRSSKNASKKGERKRRTKKKKVTGKGGDGKKVGKGKVTRKE